MFSSNQVLEITGDSLEQLHKAISFILSYDNKTFEDIQGVTEEGDSIVFGLIPFNKGLSEFREPKLRSNKNVSDFVYKWLTTSKFANKQYKRLADENDVYLYPIARKGFKVIAMSDYDTPIFSIFRVTPFWTEYDEN